MDTKINIERIKENLCVYDVRNPDSDISAYTEKDLQAQKVISEAGKCYCDNCFYGRTKLANIILNLIEKL